MNQHQTTLRVRAMMNDLTFGVEIETSGLGTMQLAQKLHDVLGPLGITTGTGYVGGYNGKTEVALADGRVFSCVTDASISGLGAEVVSPILKGEADMKMLQEVVRALHQIGVKSSAAHGCGIHVHVGVGHLDGSGLARVVATAVQYDSFIRNAVGVAPARTTWCKPIEQDRVRKLVTASTKEQVACAWYSTTPDQVSRRASNHYDHSRYYGLNLHSVFYANRGTAEFRYFDGTLHAGLVRSYVALALGIIAKSIVCKKSRVPTAITTKEQAVAVLVRIGIVGKDMKNVIKHLSTHFPAASRATSDVFTLAA